ncbi:protein SIEVE ELEMENT OCCLUSION B-like isoform X2 [Vigna umbellata]|uniref:protein SIEVE ELEMENT OCCLUSION B-like isoform X2 n=1 Tax=Vigna umbellata TaxID=87088 RepID=UPI001F5F48AB|nr:protein SIEVE ELEMENT OCCLUSION B-like isoform X2 [Vigna umbellata]
MSESGSNSTNGQQQGMMKQKQNPLEFTHDKILEDVYRTHFHCLEKCDAASLYTVASNVLNQSMDITEKVIAKGDQPMDGFKEDTSITSQQLAAKLKRIAYLMICTPRGEYPVHCTTMLILEQLKHYSWDAKVLIVEAAFALEYGKFLYLLPLIAPCQQFESSFADLHGLLMVPQNTKHVTHFNSVVKKVMQVVECITEWKKLVSAGHDIRDVPTLAETLQEIPVVVYWAIFTFVSCTGEINDFTDNKYQRHELSTNLEKKLNSILGEFKELLKKCINEIERIEDFTSRKNIVTRGRDIVKVLKALIFCGEKRDLRQNVYYFGLTEKQVKLEEFKKKCVLLFISGLENVDDDIKILNSVNEKLKEKAREVENYRSEDFKILWIPIVDQWNDQGRKKLENKLRDTKFGWYVVKYLNFETSLKLIKEVFKYEKKNVITLMNPQGKVENFDAKQIISQWGIDGFPFRTSDQTRLSQQWKWFWSEITKFIKEIENLIEEEDCYIFIYGGSDTKWVEEFTTAMDALKRKVESNVDLNMTIESFQLGKEDSKDVPRFWIAIDSLLTSRKQVKGGERGNEFATNDIKRLLFLKQDPKGWAILSKGKNVRLLGHGEAMCRTVKEFDTWHDKLRPMSFDVAFTEHYRGIKEKDGSKRCEENVICYGHPTDIVERITCPKKDCRRPMEVTSVNFKCCHQHKQ